jgi:hypothetical protein
LIPEVKIATVLEAYTIGVRRSVASFLWAKALNAQNINKEMFPVYGVKCMLRKSFLTGWQTFR